MSPIRRDRLKRLNLLLAFGQQDFGELSNGEWDTLREKLAYAIFDRNELIPADKSFMKIDAIYRARTALHNVIHELLTNGFAELMLNQQQVIIATAKGKPFTCKYFPGELQTVVLSTLIILLDRAEVLKEELLQCANPKCKKAFVPLRKPIKGKQAYCQTRCARLVAVWKYRGTLRSDQGSYGKARMKERNRSNKRYRKKVLKK